MADSPTQYGRLPTQVVASGAMAKLIRSELAVYSVIAAHVRASDLSAWPSVPTIARLGGMSERTAQRAIRQLVERGLLSVQIGGGRGRSNHYTLRLPPDAEAQEIQDDKPRRPGDTVSEGKLCHRGDTLSGEIPCQIRTETPSERRLNPVRKTPKPRHVCDTRTKEQENTAATEGTAAGIHRIGEGEGAEADPAVVRALAEAGIGGKKREELTGRWSGIPSAAVSIHDIATDLRNRGKGPGAVILELEARAEAASGQLTRQHHKEQARAEARRRAKERAEEGERRRKAGIVWLAGLSDGEVLELWQQYLIDPRVPPALRTSMTRGKLAVADIRGGFGEELAKLYGPQTTEDPGA